ncbi:hypothetical protein ITI46_30575 [Streptomyces oryzae]|uniref:Uncharacterized protein n=1 Tax=Streptomyces oryzae TaxID=1434886 RepID=A0ABS3XKM9_9ACTN|nr:hypothetical protein [Streptomyces oryzae]MBO8195959.1 hypothetical protein [Streptomyces oryzae]
MTVESHVPQLLLADLSPYQPTAAADNLLSWLAWGATAAGVFGLIVVGLQLTLQLRRGEMGEGAMYFRGFFIIVLASVIATTAGPIVEFFGPYP